MKRIAVYLDDYEETALSEMAKETGVSRSAIVREIIGEYLKRQDRKDILKYQGIGWEDDLDEMRKGRFDE